MIDEETTTPEAQPWDDDYQETAEKTAEPELPTDAAEIKALLTAEREKAAAAEAALAAKETEFNTRRSELDRSKNRILDAVRGAGLDITEGGKLAPTDPVKAAQLLVGAAPAKAEEAPTPSEDFNPWDAEHRKREIQSAVQSALKAQAEEYNAKLAAVEQFSSPQFNSQVQKQVEAALSLAGMSGVEADDNYQAMLGNTLRGIVQSGGTLTKEAVQGAALMVLPMMDADRIREVKTANEQKAATAGRTEAATARQQMGPSSTARQATAPQRQNTDASFDEAGAIIDELFDGDPRYTKFHKDLNRAVAYDSRPDAPLGPGKSATQRLIDKRLKEGRGV